MDAQDETRYPSVTSEVPSYAAVAQWIEYWPPKPRVVGSIPASRTIKINDLRDPFASILCRGYGRATLCIKDR